MANDTPDPMRSFKWWRAVSRRLSEFGASLRRLDDNGRQEDGTPWPSFAFSPAPARSEIEVWVMSSRPREVIVLRFDRDPGGERVWTHPYEVWTPATRDPGVFAAELCWRYLQLCQLTHAVG